MLPLLPLAGRNALSSPRLMMPKKLRGDFVGQWDAIPNVVVPLDHVPNALRVPSSYDMGCY